MELIHTCVLYPHKGIVNIISSGDSGKARVWVAHSSQISQLSSEEVDDDLDSCRGSEEISEASGQIQQLKIQEEDGEGLECEQEQDPDRIKIHE